MQFQQFFLHVYVMTNFITATARHDHVDDTFVITVSENYKLRVVLLS